MLVGISTPCAQLSGCSLRSARRPHGAEPRQDATAQDLVSCSPGRTQGLVPPLRAPQQLQPTRAAHHNLHPADTASVQGWCRTGASCSQPSRSHFCDSAPVTATRPLPHPTSRPLPPPHHCDAAAEPPMAGPSSRTWSSPARSPLTRRMRAAAAWALGKHAPACARGDKLPHATLSNRQSGA